MDINDVFKKVVAIVRNQLAVNPEHPVGIYTNLIKDLKADELDMVEFVMKLEEEFKIEIPDGTNLQTIDDIVKFVVKNVDVKLLPDDDMMDVRMDFIQYTISNGTHFIKLIIDADRNITLKTSKDESKFVFQSSKLELFESIVMLMQEALNIAKSYSNKE